MELYCKSFHEIPWREGRGTDPVNPSLQRQPCGTSAPVVFAGQLTATQAPEKKGSTLVACKAPLKPALPAGDGSHGYSSRCSGIPRPRWSLQSWQGTAPPHSDP